MSFAVRIFEALAGRVVVTPALRNLIEALPDDPARAQQQADAVAGMIVLNAWICCGDSALELLKQVDDATRGALRLSPRQAVISVRDEAGTASVRAEILGCTARLGFTPAHRMKVANVLIEFISALVSRGRAVSVSLAPQTGCERGLAVSVAEVGGDAAAQDVGSGRWLGLPRLTAVAEECEVRGGPGDPLQARFRFDATRHGKPAVGGAKAS